MDHAANISISKTEKKSLKKSFLISWEIRLCTRFHASRLLITTANFCIIDSFRCFCHLCLFESNEAFEIRENSFRWVIIVCIEWFGKRKICNVHALSDAWVGIDNWLRFKIYYDISIRRSRIEFWSNLSTLGSVFP